MHVFSEGKVTEPTYIDIVRAQGVPKDPATTPDVRIANDRAPGSQRKPIKLVEAAVSLMREETRKAKKAKVAAELMPEVWCLFDRDTHKSIETALKMAKEGNVKVAFSHPCFELWRLLHHKPVASSFGGVCDEAVQLLPFATDTENIKVVQPDEIERGSYAVAKKRALKINAAYGDHVSKIHRDPYTDVFTFVEDGLGIASY
ncbi:RloB family protein [Streptomyces sp. NPDC048416]|uniref:RloB family protein n=1 Tax=Streptomyces sp. NPDC048416 TaxID=3365546 RepID=UPI0037217F0B